MILVPVLQFGLSSLSHMRMIFSTLRLSNTFSPSEESLTKLTKSTHDNIKRNALDGPLLTYTMDVFEPPRVVIPANDDLRARLVREFHDTPAGDHLGREKTFANIPVCFLATYGQILLCKALSWCEWRCVGPIEIVFIS